MKGKPQVKESIFEEMSLDGVIAKHGIDGARVWLEGFEVGLRLMGTQVFAQYGVHEQWRDTLNALAAPKAQA